MDALVFTAGIGENQTIHRSRICRYLECLGVELDEEVGAAAARELLEETGIKAHALELFGVYSGKELHYVYPNGDEVSNVDVVYLCRDWSGTLCPRQGEVEELRFVSAAELPDAIMPPNRPALTD